MEAIKQLKKECHFYLDKYIISNLRVQGDKKHYQKEKRKAYHKLAQELRTDAFKCHFGNMNDVSELKKSLSILKCWVKTS